MIQITLDALWAIVSIGLWLLVVWLLGAVVMYVAFIFFYFGIHYWRVKKRGVIR